MSDTKTVIGQGIHIQGEITGSASIEVWGELDGVAGTEGVFEVRESGRVSGEIAASQIEIAGKVSGKVTAEKKIELKNTCTVDGDLTAQTIAMAEGAVFDGKVAMPRGKS